MLRLITYIDSRERFPTQLCWDEENRLAGVADCNYASLYLYDANGDRTYKLTGQYRYQNINGRYYPYAVLDNPTLYASPYVVCTPKGYTKHYYAESERIASKLGNGGLQELGHPLADDIQVHDKLFANKNHAQSVIYECLNAEEVRAFSPLSYLYELTSASQSPENERYFYHPDHLGSSSWITFTDGEAVQHLHYLPFGEDFVNQQHTVVGAMYTFSAKEKDTETGYSYFGSRYYNSDLSIWLSVDPMADKYPSLSPYTYCANNPVKLVDPNGEEMVDNPYLLFNGKTGVLEIWDDNNTADDFSDDTFIGSYEAHNNVTNTSQGKWEDGIYEMLDQQKSNCHGNKTDANGVLLDSPNGSYGTAGCYRAKPFKEKTTANYRNGMAVHAGREHKAFQVRKTEGCIRTTPEAMEAIGNAISKYGSLKRIIIQNNRTSPNSVDVNKISPHSRQQEPIVTPSMPVFSPDKTRVSISYPL